MIVSSGSERRPVRQRFPVATAGIAAACAVVFLASSRDLEAVDAELGAALTRTEDFVIEHRYLEPSAAQTHDVPAACETRLQALARDPGAAERSRDPEAQQQLDALCSELVAAWHAHPYLAWGLIPAHPSAHGWLTYAFQHSGWLHLLGNMVLLALVGTCLEQLWGSGPFLLLYASAAVSAAGAFAAVRPELGMPLIGASGAIAALMGAFLVRCWDYRIALPQLRAAPRPDSPRALHAGGVSAPAWLLLPIWFLHELGSALALETLRAGESSGDVAHWAHVGGFTYGVWTALLVQASGLEERVRDPLRRLRALHSGDVLGRAAQAERRGQPEHAFELLWAEAVARPSERGAVQALWSLALRSDRVDEVSGLFASAITDAIAAQEWESAIDDLAELRKHAPAAALSTPALLALAEGLLHEGRGRDARYALQPWLEPRDDADSPPAVAPAAIARIAALDPQLAGELRARLPGSPTAH